jgi:hypothetical protein
MPGHFEFVQNENSKPSLVYKRYFVSNPEKYMEVYEESYQQKLKEEEKSKEEEKIKEYLKEKN